MRVYGLIQLIFALLLSACTAAPAATSTSSAPVAGLTASPRAYQPDVTVLSPRPTPAKPLPSAEPTDARTNGWRTDLKLLVPGMDRFHPSLDHGTSLAGLNDAVAELSEGVPESSDDALMAGVMHIVAMVSARGCDGHLGAFIWGTGTYPVDSLPLRLWFFDEGVYIVDALAQHQDLIGSRIDAMAGRPMAEILATVDPIVPRDNEQTVRLLMPRFLLIPQVLRGLGLMDDADGPVALEVTDDRGASRDVEVHPIQMADYNAWAGAYGLHLPEDRAVLYLSRVGDDLWWQKLDDRTLFVQYNRVERRFLGDLGEALADGAVERLILDLRHNFGGEASVADQIVPLFRDWDAAHANDLFVITGRNTFSAGSTIATRLHDSSSAVIVGEPMGGCPTFWADVEPLNLPYSGIQISVPTTLEVGTDPVDARLTIEPDIPAPLTPEAWAAGDDPALDAITAAADR